MSLRDLNSWTFDEKLRSWIEEIKELCSPKEIYFCDGSKKEFESLSQLLVDQKTFIPLNPNLRPNSFLARSDPKDVARVEKQTFICSKNKEDAGPTNNWECPQKMKEKLMKLFKGCMRGRVMYVIPYCMGPIDSEQSQLGIEITDSPYVVCSMHIMTRVCKKALDKLKNGSFIPGVHSVGVPLNGGESDLAWPCNPSKCVIAHFPEEKSIWSFGSGYGGNALLGKKCFALRIASVIAREQSWLAEHMLIIGVTNPKGIKKYFAAAFPSACGKTNLAMMNSQLRGWKIECLGDDIAWMRFKEDGKLYAINPENGFFGVVPGTSKKSNPNALKAMEKNTIFTNVALTDDKDVWWEGKNKEVPDHLIDWQGRDWTSKSPEKAAHPNARFTSPASQCPSIDENWDDPKGVPIEGIIFGGRRSQTIPLVLESFNWNHGVFLGASISSETTAAAEAKVGELRHDPFAMLPFCGYHMGDYFQHWLDMGKKTAPENLPKIFSVNWFQKDDAGNFLWPGFQENMRVIRWIFESCEGKLNKKKTSIGFLPNDESLQIKDLNLSQDAKNKLFEVNAEQWKKEVEELKNYFELFKSNFPKDLDSQLINLIARLSNS